MKHPSIFAIITATAMVINACGAEPVPTISAVDVQSTAAVIAFTLVAETYEAIPTATLPLPTETHTQTPPPTNTPNASPTLAVTFTAPVPTTDPNADPCATRVLSAPNGRPTTIRIVNATRASILVSMYLNETEDKGECGYRSYNLSGRSDIIITDLVQGCYSLWAFSKEGEKVHVNAQGGGCINNDDKWTYEINESLIKSTGP